MIALIVGHHMDVASHPKASLLAREPISNCTAAEFGIPTHCEGAVFFRGPVLQAAWKIWI
jgi:hypothetical protein